jgi:glutamate synthase (NADPH) large chain
MEARRKMTNSTPDLSANLPPAAHHRPTAQGLYDPAFEHDACGMGFIVNIKGQKSHEIVTEALDMLRNMSHRGALGAEANTGDGAGILLQTPDAFFRAVCAGLGFQLPEAGQYGVGMLFLPQDVGQREQIEQEFAQIVADEGQVLLGWRTVPTDNHELGNTAKRGEPIVRQVFIQRNNVPQVDKLSFERKLFVIRRLAEKNIRDQLPGKGQDFYIASLSARTIIYKGMLDADQVLGYYPDLADRRVESAIAMIHSRFSTNTFPSWNRAHPYRTIIHNGEINTIKGNANWMDTRQALFATEKFGEDLPKVLPIIDRDTSDSGMFDNALEFLMLSGYSLPYAVMMTIPEPWSKHKNMKPNRRAFYEYHSCIMEPWDGPASIGFTDGSFVGAVLDRNGLRPSRYYVTKDDHLILASEVGVIDLEPERIKYKGRLQPGRMLLVYTDEQRIISDDEIKETLAAKQPYQMWLDEHLVRLEDLPSATAVPLPSHHTLTQRQMAFGYTFEDLRLLLAPMMETGAEALGSMGDDTPPAVLSAYSQPLYNYFKQLFAQVTNPPIDAIREELVTSTTTMLGAEGNLLEQRPEYARRIILEHPLLSNEELARLRHNQKEGFTAVTLPLLYDIYGDGSTLEQALQALFQTAAEAIDDGATLLILSDRGIDAQNGAIPALLAAAGLHHYLIRHGKRTKASLIVESGEPREVHHMAVLLGYGVDAINPYLVFESINDMIERGLIKNVTYGQAVKHYVKAAVKGIVKVLSKMGISTIQSYRGAQIFEAFGLHPSVVDKYFVGTPSRLGGMTLEMLAEEVLIRHREAFPPRPSNGHALPVGGKYQWRHDGEYHLFNPRTVHALQDACRRGDYDRYKQYSADVNNHESQLSTIRGLLQFNSPYKPIPIHEVEPIENILRRFKTGAMSYGSISAEAHESLAIAMNRVGGKSNTGEGGEDPARFKPDANGDLRRSAIKQVASGRFGVTSEYLVNADEIQIKMAQGAKPGEGGQLPGHKVYPWVAKVRHSTPGVGLISPPPHHDIYSIEDLAQLIYDLKSANPTARINVKLVSEVGVGTVAAGVAKAHADVILISGGDGGTGAAPQTSIKHAGLPWELGLAETHQTLVLNKLRSRVTVETDGQMKTGRDVVIAAILGAEEFGFATAPLVALGCLMMRVCHLNTCPVGIATQNPALRAKFTGDPAHVVNFMKFIAEEVREIMAELGVRTLPELIGRTDLLTQRTDIDHWKTRNIDLSALLHRPEGLNTAVYQQIPQDHALDQRYDFRVLLGLCKPALTRGKKVRATLQVYNTDRAVGTTLGSEVTKVYGADGLPEDTIHLHMRGSAGQSLGAFVPRGITLELEGDANDYIGKGLSGGKIIVYPPKNATFKPEENIIIGNTAFYGATGGEAYIRGMAGERFCVRNSGVTAVVEGVGDHGCEYMTGGKVVVLGATGRNFAAGMSGGVAYVLDKHGDFGMRCNQEMVALSAVDNISEQEEIYSLVQRHAMATGSQYAWHILSHWDEHAHQFVRVLPYDYKRMLDKLSEAEARGLIGEEALLAAFEANLNDRARVAGN